MSKKTGVGALKIISRRGASAFYFFPANRSFFTLFSLFETIVFSLSFPRIARSSFVTHSLSVSLSLSLPLFKMFTQSNGSTRARGSGLSSPTMEARRSSSTSRTWKRKDSAVYARCGFPFLTRSTGKKKNFLRTLFLANLFFWSLFSTTPRGWIMKLREEKKIFCVLFVIFFLWLLCDWQYRPHY